MVQFNLPEKSKVTKGNYFKDNSGSKNIKKINIYRWSPDKNEKPKIDTFEVDITKCGNKVLDVLNKIKNEIDPSLSIQKILCSWSLWFLCNEHGWEKWFGLHNTSC